MVIKFPIPFKTWSSTYRNATVGDEISFPLEPEVNYVENFPFIEGSGTKVSDSEILLKKTQVDGLNYGLSTTTQAVQMLFESENVKIELGDKVFSIIPSRYGVSKTIEIEAESLSKFKIFLMNGMRIVTIIIFGMAAMMVLMTLSFMKGAFRVPLTFLYALVIILVLIFKIMNFYNWNDWVLLGISLSAIIFGSIQLCCLRKLSIRKSQIPYAIFVFLIAGLLAFLSWNDIILGTIKQITGYIMVLSADRNLTSKDCKSMCTFITLMTVLFVSSFAVSITDYHFY